MRIAFGNNGGRGPQVAGRSPQASPDRGGGLKGRRGCIFEPACENPVTCTVIQKVTSQSAALTALL